MQSRSLLSSRFGIAILQIPANPQRCNQKSIAPFSANASYFCLYSTEDQRSRNNERVARQSGSRGPLNTPDLRFALESSLKLSPFRCTNHEYRSSKIGSELAISSLDRQSHLGRLTQEVDQTRDVMVDKELSPCTEDKPIHEWPEMAQALIRQHLEVAEQQIELHDLRLATLRQLLYTNSLERVVEFQLQRVEVQLQRIEEHLEYLRQLALTEDVSRIAAWTRDASETGIGIHVPSLLAEKRLGSIRCVLDRSEIERNLLDHLMMVEEALGRICHELGFIRWQLEIVRRANATPSFETPEKLPLYPYGLLNCWMDQSDKTQQEIYWSKSKAEYRDLYLPWSLCASPHAPQHRHLFLPWLLVAYLRVSASPGIELDDIDQHIVQSSPALLQRISCSLQDLSEWGWIFSARDTKVMIERFLSTSSAKPTFLLRALLRRDDLDVRSLNLLLIYSWDRILRPAINTRSDLEVDADIPRATTSPSNIPLAPLSPASFYVIFRGLLRQALRIWPAAIVSVSHMFEPFVDLHIGSWPEKMEKLDAYRWAKVCRLYNRSLPLLSLPASINPLQSMTYNWQALRVLLEMSTRLKPALLLDHDSYRAVARVLAASKKTEKESRAASLRTRTWPPWRVEQDGMDAQRLPEDDLSRVIVIANQAKASGYGEEAQDRAIKVIGGQDSDGTPTIPTRMLLMPTKLRSSEADVWAARIHSTRDVQESWAAFLNYQQQGFPMHESIYFAMIMKMIYEAKRSTGICQSAVPPGSGRELQPPSTDNYSSFYQSRLQPPSIEEFYVQMMRAKFPPKGRLLSLLIKHARNPDEAFGYLVDSGMGHWEIAFLEGRGLHSRGVFNQIPKHTWLAFIKLLCRLTTRVIPAAASLEIHYRNGVPHTMQVTEGHSTSANELKIRYLGSKFGPVFRNPLLHCANLLKMSQTKFRPAWYAFFEGLVRRGSVLDQKFLGDPKHDIIAWKVLVAALGDFHACGLQLDPAGFRLLCIGLEKAIQASFKLPEEDREVTLGKGQQFIVIKEFMKLSEVAKTPHSSIPKLLYDLSGVHLHAYLRALGFAQDHGSLMYCLRWMVKNHLDLDPIVRQAHNGPSLFQRALVALKAFLSHTKYEAEAEELVNSVQTWEGWPSDSDVHAYLEQSPEVHDMREQAEIDHEDKEATDEELTDKELTDEGLTDIDPPSL